jgi:hypothetical protein
MSRFIKVIMRDRVEGAPGFVGPQEIEVVINLDQVTLFNSGEEDEDITFVRLSCGATLCIVMPYKDFYKEVRK